MRSTNRGMFLACILLAGCGALGRGCGLVGRLEDNAANTVYDQFSPAALLAKYEWFKDTSAALDAKKATIDVFEHRHDSTAMVYGKDASKWPRDVRETLAQKDAELAGLKASFNSLAADYNAQMSKFNWRFTNAGDLPQGATTVLPRTYKSYVEE